MGPFIRGFLSSSLLFLVLIFIFGMSPGRKNKKKNISKRNFELIKSNRDDTPPFAPVPPDERESSGSGSASLAELRPS